MTISIYDKGDVVRITGAFTNSLDAGVDPDAVTFSYLEPDGSATTLVYLTDAALVKDSTGNYHVDLSADLAGRWRYRWAGTGTNAAAHEGEFQIKDSRVV